MNYPIHEMFRTFQGEGCNMGLPAFFIRLYGCPVHCPWCDSAGTWHKDWVPSGIVRRNEAELAAYAMDPSEPHTPFVVVTGGEPCVHDLIPLVEALHEERLEVFLETSGSFEIRGMFDWITVSPKRWKMPVASSYELADEFKVIVEKPEDISFYFQHIKEHRHNLEDAPVWLHPEWSQRHCPEVLNAISRAVKEGEGVFRAGYQLHKLYAVDSLDARSRPLVPLGGDPAKGY